MMIRKNILSLFVALFISILSLTSSDKFHNIPIANFRGLDKIIHFILYFVFMAVILYEHRNRAAKISNLVLLALFPLIFGVLMEALQAWLTITRTGSFYDLLFNAAGIFVSIFLFLLMKSFKKGQII
jgi:VanZ family protein